MHGDDPLNFNYTFRPSFLVMVNVFLWDHEGAWLELRCSSIYS
jgi:hypothetical protein